MPGASLLTARELANIPLSLRTLAKAIADTSKPLKTIATLLLELDCRLGTGNYNGTLGSNLLPLISALLDPSRMPPEPSDSPSSSSTFRGQLLCASRAILVFSSCPASTIRSHTSSLWPLRIWPWLELMDNYDCFPDDCEAACGRCLMLTALYPMVQLPRSPASKTVFRTPGFPTFLVHMWKRIICTWKAYSAKRSSRDRRPERNISPPVLLTPFLQCCFEFTDVVDELVEGAGGMDALAALLFQHIQLIHRDGEALFVDESDTNLALFGECVQSMDVAKNFVDYLGNSKPSAWVALVGAGYFGLAADMFTSFATSATNHPPRSVLAAWQYLQHIIGLLPHVDSERLVTAVGSGFVLACRMCGRNVFAQGIQTVEEFAPLDFVLSFVAQATCDYRSLCDMADSLSMALEYDESPGNACAPAIWTGWFEFKTLIQSRLQLAEEFEAKDFSSNRACWNIECPLLKVPKSELRKCARCHLALYCSPACQKSTWKTYGHRSLCRSATAASKSDHRDTRFSLLLTLRDYQAHKTTILLQQLAYIKRTGDTEFCVVMHYTSGRCASAVVALASKAKIWESHPSSAWDADEGRKELHVVRFHTGGGKSREIALALRRSTSAVLEGLVAVAEEIPEGVDVMQLAVTEPVLFERVRALAGLDLVETYEGDANWK
ncbi:hypothetical protein R3P38DRAFT_2791934 [Favolaschia claudopus]|uniref:MYND-type domain-containing protein n=1 Tax=Favolaschia claudopus TaxID=2862362 RepID=A0AAW0AG06_9AGAR